MRRIAQFTARYTTAPVGRLLQRVAAPLVDFRLPRGAGVAASAFLILASLVYGSVRGGHVEEFARKIAELRDNAANTIGFRVGSIALDGHKQISREEVLALAGITGRTSLLFLDADNARMRLKGNPWIADATVLKLYPDQLQVKISEREAFALWQKKGRLSVIADDGTVLEPYAARRFAGLPLVVGAGADVKAKDFLALVGQYPEIRDAVQASVLVAERRWNLRLKNGVDIRLPESEIERALETLVALDREKRLLSRDIAAIDLRLPDRVSVQLSDEAAQAREEATKPKIAKRKAGAV